MHNLAAPAGVIGWNRKPDAGLSARMGVICGMAAD